MPGPEPAAPALDPAAFARLMTATATEPPVAVAVSGGADSMALALCAAAWAPGRVRAFTVDHGLRPAAAAEADTVAGWMAARGIPHRILRWTGPKPAAGIQQAARDARYALLAEACRDAGIGSLLLGHHAHDQMETVLMRLGRGSGPAGLRGMAPVRVTDGLRLVRPFLGIAPARLRTTLTQAGQPWIDDPSNADPHYQRVRLRALLPALAAAGVTAAGVATAIGHLADAESALGADVAALVAAAVTLDPAGHARLDPVRFAAAHPEIRRRLVEGLAGMIGGGTGHQDRGRAAGLAEALAAGLAGGRTFAGCRFLPGRGGVLVCREAARIAADVPLADGLLWDGRFRVEAPGLPAGLSLRPLRTLSALPAPRPEVAAGGASALPAAVREGLPSVWEGPTLLAVPHLGYGRRPARGDRLISVTLTFRPHRSPMDLDSVLASAAACVISF